MTWQLGSCNLRHLLILHTVQRDAPPSINLEMVASALAAAPSVCIRTPSGARQIRRASGRNARVARVRPEPRPRSDSTVSSDTITRNRPQRAIPAVISAAVAPQKVLIVNTNGGGHANIGFWLAKTLAAQGVPAKETSVSCQADIRYQGQGLQLTVDFDLKDLKKGDLSIIGDPFDEMHKQLFTFALDSDKEIVNLRAVAQGKSAEIEARKLPKSGSRNPVNAAKLGTTTVFMDGKDREATLYQRDQLKAGNKIEGPAVVLEMDSTTVILAGHTGNVDEFGNILIAPTA